MLKMKTFFCAVLICMSFSMAKGQCFDDNDFRIVSSCDGSVRSGSGGRKGNVSVTCGTPVDSTTTPLVFTVTTLFTLGSKFPMQSNIGVTALSAAGGIVLLVSIVVSSFVMLRRKNRKKKAKSPEVDASLSYMVFDSRNKLSDNNLYDTCQTVEDVELNVTSKQNQETVSSQHTALNTMHRIGTDYDVPLSDKPVDKDTSSICLYEVPYTNRLKHDSSPMPLYAVPHNSFIKRGPLPTLMNAAINVSINSKSE